MKTDVAQYRIECWANNIWRVIEHVHLGDNVYDNCDWTVNYETYDEALRALRYIKWIEEIYSPPRK